MDPARAVHSHRNDVNSGIASAGPHHDCRRLTMTAGYLSTRGNQIVDDAGNAVKLNGVNWFGLESTRFAPDGLHVRNYKEMMEQMVDLGFNTIRLPFSNQLFDSASSPSGINYAPNPDQIG